MLQNSLLNLNYEVMISKDTMLHSKDGSQDFLQNFDLIIYQQSMYNTLNEELLECLILQNKPVVVLTFESEETSNLKALEHHQLCFIHYPISVTELAGKLSMVFDQANNQEDRRANGQERDISVIYSNNERMKRQLNVRATSNKKKQHAFYLKDHTLIMDDRLIPLTKREYQVLDYLVKSDQKFFSSQALAEAVWSNTKQKNKQALLSNLITKIKQKVMEETMIQEPFILNKKGIGYYVNQEFVPVKKDQQGINTVLVGNG